MTGEPTLFRLRVRYVKQGRLRYLGHLEVAHTIERVVRRAGLPYAVTQGFKPHMRVAFSSALPVGTASLGEWYDLVLTDYVPVRDALPALQVATPPDLQPVEASYVDMRAPALTAWLTHATYRVALWLTDGYDLPVVATAAARALDELRATGSIPYLRGTKRKQLDLTRTLEGARVAIEVDHLALELDTYMDNDGALRPEILLAALDARIATAADPTSEAAEIVSGAIDYRVFRRIEVTRVSQSPDA